MVLLMVITVGYLPLVLPILSAGRVGQPGEDRPLAGSADAPSRWAGALAVNAKLPAAAARAKPLFDRLSSLGLVLVVLLLVVVNFNDVLSLFGTRAILAGLLFIALGYAVGWALGGPGSDTRSVLGLGTAQRNIAAGLVVGSQSFSNPRVVVMVVVVAMVSLLHTPAAVAAAGQEWLVAISVQAADGVPVRVPAGERRWRVDAINTSGVIRWSFRVISRHFTLFRVVKFDVSAAGSILGSPQQNTGQKREYGLRESG